MYNEAKIAEKRMEEDDRKRAAENDAKENIETIKWPQYK